MFARKNNKQLLIYLIVVLITAVGVFLRSNGLLGKLPFWSETARDLFMAEKVIESIQSLNLRNLPLEGPFADTYLNMSIRHGVFYYYLLSVPVFIFDSNPYGVTAFIILLNVLSIPLIFYVGRTIFNPLTGIIAAILLSTSSIVVWHSRFIWNPNIAIFFILAIITILIKISQGKKNYYLLFAALSGIFTQTHILANIFVLSSLFSLIVIRPVLPNRKIIIASLFLFLVPQVPFLFYLLRNPALVTDSFKFIETTINSTGGVSNLFYPIAYLYEETTLFSGVYGNFFSIPLYSVATFATLILTFSLFFEIMNTLRGRIKLRTYDILIIGWLISSLVILFLSKSHLERGINQTLLFSLPILLLFLSKLISYGLEKRFLWIFALTIILGFTYYNFLSINQGAWRRDDLTLENHILLAEYLGKFPFNYNLEILDYVVDDSVWWSIREMNIHRPEKINNQIQYRLQFSQNLVVLRGNDTEITYVISRPSEPKDSCNFERVFGSIRLYRCNVI